MAIKNGFSLIELTVVIGLISLLTLAISASLLANLMASNRLRNTTAIKQAGNYVLDQFQTLLRNAKAIDSCDSSANTITITNFDGYSTTLATEIASSNTLIASNSGVFLTPSSLNVSNYSITCYPSDTNPQLVSVSFDLANPSIVHARESRTLHFETSVNLRNQ